MLRIGDLSRLARVSVKTLRHYDAIGLLPADYVERSNGYRYYALATVERLQRILALKDLGFGLDAIAALLEPGADPQMLESRFADQRARLKTRIARDRAALRQIEACLAEPSLAGGGSLPLVRALPPVLAYAHRARVMRGSDAIEAMFEAAEARVAAKRTRADASPFLILHDPEHRAQTQDVEVCIPVVTAAGLGAVRLVPGCASAGTTIYKGPYHQTAPLYATMVRWLAASGRRVRGPLREVYQHFGADQQGYSLPSAIIADRPDDYVTELQVPLR